MYVFLAPFFNFHLFGFIYIFMRFSQILHTLYLREIKNGQTCPFHQANPKSRFRLSSNLIHPNGLPRIDWSGQRDSNSWHQAWEACTLPAELCPLFAHSLMIMTKSDGCQYISHFKLISALPGKSDGVAASFNTTKATKFTMDKKITSRYISSCSSWFYVRYGSCTYQLEALLAKQVS